MKLEEYKILMKFHILTGNGINPKLKYFAVDTNGIMYGYRMKPLLDVWDGACQWMPRGEYINNDTLSDISLEHQRIIKMPPPADYTKTLIRI